MAAPRYVRTDSLRLAPSYSSPKVVPQRWGPDRPAELSFGQPVGGPLGYQGPDQGYALKLTGLFDDRITLTETDLAHGVQLQDVHAGCVQVGLKRASLLGRAPVVYDLEIAYRCWGWLDDNAPTELVSLRSECFAGVSDSHHYTQARRLVAAVRAEVLLQSPADVAQLYDADWRQVLDQPLASSQTANKPS